VLSLRLRLAVCVARLLLFVYCSLTLGNRSVAEQWRVTACWQVCFPRAQEFAVEMIYGSQRTLSGQCQGIVSSERSFSIYRFRVALCLVFIEERSPSLLDLCAPFRHYIHIVLNIACQVAIRLEGRRVADAHIRRQLSLTGPSSGLRIEADF
jgi:hypothetical protein